MSTAVQINLKLDEVPSNHNSADPRENFLEDDDEDNTPTINDVESIRKAIIKTSKNKAQAPYTILLVGETGVGKSSVLEFIGNVLAGNDIDHYNFDILDHTNELGGPNNQSQTNSTRLYELTSKNGIVVRIIDTPGLADTRTLQQDELHKRTTQIKNLTDSVTAVLILANGTVPRSHVDIDYTLSILSTIFPKALTENIGLMFTNMWGPLGYNVCEDTVPTSLQGAIRFRVDSPIALQKKYLKLKNEPNMNVGKANLRILVKAGEENALRMLVDLFDWLDGLKPQPITEIVPHNSAPMGQNAAKGARRSATLRKKRASNHVHTLRVCNTDRDVNQAQLGKMSNQMLGLLKTAEEKIRKGIWKVLWIFFGK